MKKYYIDTNIVIRFLLQDHKALSPRANRLFEQAENGECILILTDVALAEAVWVLTSVYNIDRRNVGGTLAKLVVQKGIQCPGRAVLLEALTLYQDKNCDFFDCYLAALAKESDDGIASFDKDMKKFKDISLWEG